MAVQVVGGLFMVLHALRRSLTEFGVRASKGVTG